jgi:hypothetical protein
MRVPYLQNNSTSPSSGREKWGKRHVKAQWRKVTNSVSPQAWEFSPFVLRRRAWKPPSRKPRLLCPRAATEVRLVGGASRPSIRATSGLCGSRSVGSGSCIVESLALRRCLSAAAVGEQPVLPTRRREGGDRWACSPWAAHARAGRPVLLCPAVQRELLPEALGRPLGGWSELAVRGSSGLCSELDFSPRNSPACLRSPAVIFVFGASRHFGF